MKKTLVVLVSLLVLFTMMLSACAPAAAPEKIVETVVVEKKVEVEKVVEKTVVVEVEAAPAEDDIAKAKEFLKGKKICAVLPGPVNDGGWNGAAYGGLTNLRDNFGMAMAYRERTKPEEAADLMRQYAESGCNIIQAHGSEYMDQINAVALEYPDIQFMQLSRCAGQEPNLIGLCFSTGGGGYVIGRLAAYITKTGKVAFVVGQKYPNMDWQPNMAQVAAKDLKDEGKISIDVAVEEKEVGSWDDPAKAKEITKALIEQGYDVFVGIADAGDVGTIEAVKEAHAAGKEVWFIPWVKDRNYLGPDFILGGWTEDAALQVQYAAVHYALNGAPIGKGFPLGVEDGVAYLNPTYGLVSQEIDMDVYATFAKVRDDPASIPNLVVRDDL
ncbi:MAG: BMP family protein [Anaerolineaceae bacterium]|nr:BMP family protein [Anaerolineaceae bacterium]